MRTSAGGGETGYGISGMLNINEVGRSADVKTQLKMSRERNEVEVNSSGWMLMRSTPHFVVENFWRMQ